MQKHRKTETGTNDQRRAQKTKTETGQKRKYMKHVYCKTRLYAMFKTQDIMLNAKDK